MHGKKIVVIGLGKTGVATARFLGSKGCRVVVADEKAPDFWDDQYKSIANEKWLEEGPYNTDILHGADIVVPSPGIPPYNDILVAAVRGKIPVISEIELAYRFLNKPLVAVTGTNGKTTTTTLISEIFKTAGKKVFVGGNIGNPLIEYAGTLQTEDFIVAEISSFQLQWIEKFRPLVSILLNITCDHINYHGSFDEYRRIKAGIFCNQTESDFAVLNNEDPACELIASGIRGQIAGFSSVREVSKGIYLKDDAIVLNLLDGSQEKYPLDMIKIPGLHNIENVMAAVLAARFCGCSKDGIITTIANFRGLAHRIEYAGEKKGVKFFDDSKGTNVGSVIRAMDIFSEPVILLLGGRDKDGDFDNLQPIIKKKARKVLLFGEARDHIASLIGNYVPTEKKVTLREAVVSAYENANAGDVVLLSPGCASFDEFKNYKERGTFFKEVVGNL